VAGDSTARTSCQRGSGGCSAQQLTSYDAGSTVPMHLARASPLGPAAPTSYSSGSRRTRAPWGVSATIAPAVSGASSCSMHAMRSAARSVGRRSTTSRTKMMEGWVAPVGGEDRSEVGVGGDDGPPVREGQVDDVRIGRSGCVEVADVHRVMSGVAEQTRDPGRQVLVDEQVHAGERSRWTCTSVAAAAYSSACWMSARSRSG
jgi:hypothetical protein